MRVARWWLRLSALACAPLVACPEPPRGVPETTKGATDASFAEADVPPPPVTSSVVDAAVEPAACSDDLPKGSPKDARACPAPGYCVEIQRGCCSPCGMPGRCDLYAVAKIASSALRDALCPAPEACPACATMDNPWLHAFCVSGTCALVDVRTDAISACDKDDDCVARTMSCCDDCTGAEMNVALRKDKVDEYRAQICGKTKCASCAGKPPPSTTHVAICDAVRKHCVLAK